MKIYSPCLRLGRALRWAVPAVLLAFSSYTIEAQDLLIEARTDFSQYLEEDGNWQNSSVHTTAPGTTSGIGSRFNTTVGSSVTLTPVLNFGGSYYLEVAFFAPPSQTSDAIVTIDIVGATLSEFGPGTTMNGEVIETTAFREEEGDSATWRRIGLLTLDPEQAIPEIKFTFISGTDRFYSDAYRFVDASDPCLSGLPTLNTVNGPLAAGQTFVNVPGVSEEATAVTVYADGVQIGQRTADIVGGETVVEVETSALVAGQIITVTQSNADGVESCRPNTGPIVGSGPNPNVRVAFSLRMDTGLTGPIGAEGSSDSSWLWMLGATGPSAGFGTAPLGGAVLYPSTCWQTVTFNYAFDPGYTWAGSGGVDLPTFAILDSIAFSMEFPHDSGPYQIYIDNIQNGNVIIEDFEGQTNGTPAYLFTQPGFSGSTSGFLLSQPPGSPTPNLTVVTNANADTGEHSTLVSWQFKDTAEASWLRLPLVGSGRMNPQVDLSQPITVRFLVLPVGETAGKLQVTSIGNQQHVIGENVTLEVAPIGEAGALTYQWRRDGADLAGETGSTLTIENAQADASGLYSVVVSDGTCTTESFGTITISDEVLPPSLELSQEGTSITLTWDDPLAVLEAATELTGSASDWSTVEGAVSGHTEDISTGTRFFRLRR